MSAMRANHIRSFSRERCSCKRNASRTTGAGRSRSVRGFTLLETLVALTILATGIVSILLLFPVAMERHRISSVRTMTTAIAQTELGKLRAGDTDFSFSSWLRDNRLKLTNPNQVENQHIYGWVTSSQPMGELNQGLYRVTIELRLQDGRKEYYSTYVTDR